MKSIELSEFIRSARISARYKSTRDLWSAINESQEKINKEWISYAYFHQIETQGRIPDIEDFLTIVKFLGLDEKKACYLYAKSIMPNERTKSYFDFGPGSAAATPLPFEMKTNRMEPDQVYELSPEQIYYFAQQPEAYDVALILADTNRRKVEEIAEAADLSVARTKKILDELIKKELAVKDGTSYRFVRSSLRLSGNQTTKELQWNLYSRHLKAMHMKFYDSKVVGPKYRTSMVCPLKKSGAEQVLNELRQVIKKVDALELDPSDDTEVYYMGLVFGPRFNEGAKK